MADNKLYLDGDKLLNLLNIIKFDQLTTTQLEQLSKTLSNANEIVKDILHHRMEEELPTPSPPQPKKLIKAKCYDASSKLIITLQGIIVLMGYGGPIAIGQDPSQDPSHSQIIQSLTTEDIKWCSENKFEVNTKIIKQGESLTISEFNQRWNAPYE